jgi:hypothetical protein
MDSFSEFSTKKYIGSDDVRDGSKVGTIKAFNKVKIEQDGNQETVSVVTFEEFDDRGVILKSTTLTQLAEMFGTPSKAIGQKVELYLDKNVSFGGKKVGGLRFREPTGQAATTNAAPF